MVYYLIMMEAIMVKKLVSIISIISLGLVLAACEETKQNNDYYVDLKDQPADYEFKFSTDLPEKIDLHPNSVGTVYYVSEDGDDLNNGLTSDKAIKTLSRASELELKAGDSVLFKKGDSFEGTLVYSN